MSCRNKILAIVPAIVLGIGLSIPAIAQDASSSPAASAGTSMDRAGEDSEGAAKNVYHGTVTAMDDTKITTEVKAAFVSGKDIHSNEIHVSTTAGIVTLRGHVQNSDMAARAGAIAKNSSGVRGVNNHLRVSPSD
ncbi:MAG: BON domain-containing protein [Candidatus Binataceae bacterium]|jgi:osmotically-inducible protein OsmY